MSMHHDGQSTLIGKTLTLIVSLVAAFVSAVLPARGGDWPMWRYDAARSAASPDALPAELHLRWTRELPTPIPAWPKGQRKLQFDAKYEPVVANKTIFVPSMVRDSLTAYDTDTGTERWRFYADGPIRFAPVADAGRVYFVSDDGHLYALNAADGSLRWKFRGGPGDRTVLGNRRLISAWPARGAPVLIDGTIYFAASIWPFMGIFIHAIDAETGTVVWTNSGQGTDYTVQQHGSPAFSGAVPQGYLTATQEHLLVPCGRSMPAVFDRHTGDMLHFDIASRDMGTKGGGGYGVIATASYYINAPDAYDLADGKFFAKCPATVVTDDALIGAGDAGGLVGLDPTPVVGKGKDRRGNVVDRRMFKPKWASTLETPIARVHLKSGRRVYGVTGETELVAVDLPEGDRPAKVSWRTRLDAEPLTVLAGDDKLFAVTENRLFCFGEKPVTAPVTYNSSEAAIASEFTDEVTQLLDATGIRAGYALVLGIGDGRLIEALIDRTSLYVIAVDPDATVVQTLRRRLDALGVYGTRAGAFVGDPLSFAFPPYLADLIISANPTVLKLSDNDERIENLFSPLRPYGGRVGLKLSTDAHGAFARHVAQANLENADVRRKDGYTLLVRSGPLPGAGSWTHQSGDAGNTVFSSDRRVRAPLGLLWFGGLSHDKVLPRHGHGPTPQVVGGRLFIEGPDMLRAVDVYTGRLHWEREFPGVGRFYNYTSHEPGANALGSNFVSVRDGVYVVHDNACLRLDPATGETLARLELPREADGAGPAEWSYISIGQDLLIAGTRPNLFESRAFTDRDFRRLRGEQLEAAVAMVGSWKNFEPIKKSLLANEQDYVRRNLNKLLSDPDILTKIPDEVRKRADAGAIEQRLEDLLSQHGSAGVDTKALEAVNRQLLVAYYDLPAFRPSQPGQYGNHQRKASARLVVMNRMSGEVLGSFDAHHAFRHNAIAVGGGRIYCIDRMPDAEASYHKRRGRTVDQRARVVAVDARTCDVVWESTERVTGTWLSYSAEHDVLLQAGSRFGDRAIDESPSGMVAYQGATGSVLWQNDLTYYGPCILYHDQVLTQGYRTPGVALSLLTGETITRADPITGVMSDWGFTRNYGCNTAIASEHMLTFRSAAAGFYDMSRDGGTGNFGGFRSGCTSNLLVADGVLNAPDYTRTCTCSYPNQTSLALVPMPDVEMWTFNHLTYSGKPVRRVGINFGAPGDRRADNATLWIEHPSVGGTSPVIPIDITPANHRYTRYHATHVSGPGLDWVAASGIEGAEEIKIQLAADATQDRNYTVRLHFADTAQHEPGRRVFDVALNGRNVLTDFDIVRDADGPNRSLVKTFADIAADTELRITLTAKTGKTLLGGVEIITQE